MNSANHPTVSRREKGKAAEELTVKYLIKHGFKIIARNVSYRNIGELDIIALEGDVICFVEVRSRSDTKLGQPSETVGFIKQRKIRRLAQRYLDITGIDNPARFDVSSVVWLPKPTIHYIEDAF
jgi:putative endonuclease